MADAGDIYARMGQNLGKTIAEAMGQYHKEHVAYDKQYQLAQALAQIGIDPKTGQTASIMDEMGKKRADIQPLMDTKALDLITKNASHGRAGAAGALEAVNRITLGIAQHAANARASEAATPKYAVPTQYGTVQATAGEALTSDRSAAEAPEREARTELIKTQTEASKAKMAAEGTEPTVLMDIGGNQARVPISKLIEHPDLLKDPNTKDLYNNVFMSTGLTLQQVSQGQNKRYVNGQLTFDAPIVQQEIDQLTGKPKPKYNPDGTPMYQQKPNPAYKSTTNWLGQEVPENPNIQKTMPDMAHYQIPKEYTPDVIRLFGTQGVEGADQVKLPDKQATGTSRIVPGSVGAGTGPQPGDTRAIGGQQAVWGTLDGGKTYGWLPAQ